MQIPSFIVVLASFLLVFQPLSIEATYSYCDSYITVHDDCFDQDNHHSIGIYTKNCYPKKYDWVALVHDTGINEEYDNKGKDYWVNAGVYSWKFVCGSRKCAGAWKYKSNHFKIDWDKLESGEYKVYLFSNDGYFVKAESETITVKKEGSCSSIVPTTAPTPYPTASPTACADSHKSFRVRFKYFSKWKRCRWAAYRNTATRCRRQLKNSHWKRVEDGKLYRTVSAALPTTLLQCHLTTNCYANHCVYPSYPC